MVALERLNVRETVGRKNNCKLNFFSMYFVRNNEEIHLSFKNSEKLRTQALTITSADNSDIICITKTKNILICLHANANKFMTLTVFRIELIQIVTEVLIFM